MPVSLETLLTHPRAFGLTQATPVQRAACRVAEGLPLGDLAQDEAVIRSLGGIDAIDDLPLERPKEFYLVAAIRCGKSLLCAAIALHIALTIDLERVGIARHEVARVSVVSLDLDKAAAVMEHLMGALEREDSILGRFLVKHPKPTPNRLRIRREDGRCIDVMVAAGKRGGGSLVSRWTVAAVFDEAARMQGQADGVVNFEQMRQAVIARLTVVRGAQLVVVSSPWAARGPVYEAVQKNTGKPSKKLVLMRATGPEMNPVLWTPEACAETLRQDEAAYQTDVLGEFVDAEQAFFSHLDLVAATRPAPLRREREEGITYGAAMDPATSSNAWTLVIAGKVAGETEQDDTYFVAHCCQWQGSKLKPLKAREVYAEMRPILEAYGLSEVYTDRWAFALIQEMGGDAGVTVTPDESTSEEKAKRWLSFRTRIVARTVELAPDPMLRADLQSVIKRLTPNGMAFDLPLTRDGRHADYAPAVVLAVEVAAQAPNWVSAMEKFRKNGGRMWSAA